MSYRYRNNYFLSNFPYGLIIIIFIALLFYLFFNLSNCDKSINSNSSNSSNVETNENVNASKEINEEIDKDEINKDEINNNSELSSNKKTVKAQKTAFVKEFQVNNFSKAEELPWSAEDYDFDKARVEETIKIAIKDNLIYDVNIDKIRCLSFRKKKGSSIVSVQVQGDVDLSKNSRQKKVKLQFQCVINKYFPQIYALTRQGILFKKN